MELAVKVAEQAAVLIMDVYREKKLDVQFKSDNTPVTQADLLAHHLIVNQLQQVTDSNHNRIPVLSEESVNFDWQERKSWQTYWLIDPLDGTKEFVAKNDEFTVNIALIHLGQPVVGVVLAPALDAIYMAARGVGAFKKTQHQPLLQIKVRSVPEINGEQQYTILTGRRTVSPSIVKLFKHLPNHHKVYLGSSLKSCYIAEGLADLYPRYGKTSEWDTAAAQCILECAGGSITDLQLTPLKYNSKDSLINPPFIAWGDATIQWALLLEQIKNDA